VRVGVYVDGFNLYYRAVRKTAYKWLNPLALAKSLLDPDDTVGMVRYFTAVISPRTAGDPSPQRQQVYLSALRTLPELRINYGRFLPKTKTRPLVSDPSRYVEVHDTEEKGSDVNLAAFLLRDGWLGHYDAALVVSQDSDLCEAIRIVKTDIRKPVGVAWLDGGNVGRRFTSASSFVRHVTPARLAAAQFPDRLMGRNGHWIVKPPEWTRG
jgi:hypothetical protein